MVFASNQHELHGATDTKTLRGTQSITVNKRALQEIVVSTSCALPHNRYIL